MLTVSVLRISEVLWNSAFMKVIPGATIDDERGLAQLALRLSLQKQRYGPEERNSAHKPQC